VFGRLFIYLLKSLPQHGRLLAVATYLLPFSASSTWGQNADTKAMLWPGEQNEQHRINVL